MLGLQGYTGDVEKLGKCELVQNFETILWFYWSSHQSDNIVYAFLDIVWTVLLRDDESPTSGNKAQGVLIQDSVRFSGLETDSLLITIIRSFDFRTNGRQ